MPATNRFPGACLGPDGPYEYGFAITPADATDLVEVTSAIHIGGAGALAEIGRAHV